MRRAMFVLILAVGCSSEPKKSEPAKSPSKDSKAPAATSPASQPTEPTSQPTEAAPPDKAPAALVTTPSGLQYRDDKVGTGASPIERHTVVVNYKGTLTDGTKFDSSYDRNEPFDFKIGVGAVIKGWDEGVMGMKVGGKRHLVIPPELAYGAEGIKGVIPPNATLVFDVELLEVR
jgi:peptidylprolyl isomerase